jgi:hypothetical protein
MKAVLSFIAIEIFADVHRAVFASARPNQHLESQKRKAPSKIKSKRLLKRKSYNKEHDLFLLYFYFRPRFFFFKTCSLSSICETKC